MQHLILFRHAKAERQAASGDDFDRALAERGREDARLMGRVLFEAGLKPELALVSSARRTRETWDEAAAAFGPVETRHDKTLYNAASTTLRRLVERHEDMPGDFVLVGHNPGIHQLAIELLIEGAASASILARAASRFPTASAAVFSMDAAGRPTWDGLYFAADYGGGGPE